MGSPSGIYKWMLKEMIRLGTHEFSIEKNEKKLESKSTDELERIVKNELPCSYPFKCFYAGFAVSEFFNKFDDSDSMTAACASVPMIYDLLNIKEEDDEDEE